MKFNNILNFIILMFITSILNAQEFYSYKLFNDNFKTIFPSSPVLSYDKGSIKMYSYSDKQNGIDYISKYISYSSIFKND